VARRPAGLHTRNDGILESLEPFLVAAPWHRDRFDRRPFGLAIPDENVLDPTRLSIGPFLDRLFVLDRLTFGPEGMPMARWVAYDCAGLPGAIFGFAARAESLPPAVARRLELADGSTGLVPLSMYIAIPVRPPDQWFGHNLASLNTVVPELGLKGLGSMTKALALRVFGCRAQLGATQWDSVALHIHTRFGPLELLTAWTPAHSEPGTLTYRVMVTEQTLRFALGDPDARLPRREATMIVAAEDEPAMRGLQERIEAGARYVITGPPRHENGGISVPVAPADDLPSA
jgi:hypothetical protein